ncbi:Transcription factor TFIIE alpha subunit C-terminal [Trinorchestia longiramus]|nr:Transcription factor TFIIE alpha subunit C-terminal [Trinorchestia longiramus]
MEGEVLTEVPTCLQKLVQMVVRGFYTVEDMLIIDMLVRNLCLSEDSICDLLKFDRKMLRQRINTLKTDKLLQTKMKMITVEDGKSQREQYYFINYKSFVNVVKYKLDHIRKKLEMEERDQTSRASFVCSNCQRTYTDLEADQLLDPMTGMLVCIICKTEVQEDMSAAPRSDSRLLLTRFNEQLEPLFTLLKEVENIKLAAEFSDPNPQELSINKKAGVNRHIKSAADSRAWSGDATKRQGFQVEGSIDVTINTENTVEETQKAKEEPAWLSQASSFITAQITTEETDSSQAADGAGAASGPSMSTAVGPTAVVETVAKVGPTDVPQKDDVLSLLEAHEPKSKKNGDNSDSDDSVEELPKKQPAVVAPFTYNEESLEGMLDSDEETEGDNVPLISVGGERIPLTAVDNAVISRMTQQEKNLYINVYQEYMTGMEDL